MPTRSTCIRESPALSGFERGRLAKPGSLGALVDEFCGRSQGPFMSSPSWLSLHNYAGPAGMPHVWFVGEQARCRLTIGVQTRSTRELFLTECPTGTISETCHSTLQKRRPIAIQDHDLLLSDRDTGLFCPRRSRSLAGLPMPATAGLSVPSRPMHGKSRVEARFLRRSHCG